MGVTEGQIEGFYDALIGINRFKAAEIFNDIQTNDGNFEDLEHLTMEALEKIGVEWEAGRVSLSQVYMSSIICEDLMQESIPSDQVIQKKSPKLAIGVLLDHHGLGKRIVSSVLRASGYNLIDFGHGLSVDEMVEKTLKEEVDILLISTLVLPSALKVKEVVTKLREKGSAAKVVVGGAPFRMDPVLWKKVKADAVGKNGAKVKQLIENLEAGGDET